MTIKEILKELAHSKKFNAWTNIDNEINGIQFRLKAFGYFIQVIQYWQGGRLITDGINSDTKKEAKAYLESIFIKA